MNVFKKCGNIYDFYHVLERISRDGYGYITHNNSDIEIKVQMQLIETYNSVILTNVSSVDITPLRKGIKRFPYINIEDSTRKRILVKLDKEFALAEIDKDTQITIRENQLNITMEI